MIIFEIDSTRYYILSLKLRRRGMSENLISFRFQVKVIVRFQNNTKTQVFQFSIFLLVSADIFILENTPRFQISLTVKMLFAIVILCVATANSALPTGTAPTIEVSSLASRAELRTTLRHFLSLFLWPPLCTFPSVLLPCHQLPCSILPRIISLRTSCHTALSMSLQPLNCGRRVDETSPSPLAKEGISFSCN